MASLGGPVVCLESIAADGAMVAAVLVGLGHPSLLLANNVGGDSSGAHVYDWLCDRGVETTARMVDGPPTPHVAKAAALAIRGG